MTSSLFVYGTLKRGFAQHARYCGHALSVEPARARGRLYVHDDGYPALIVPFPDILGFARGRGCDACDAHEDSAAAARMLLLDESSIGARGTASPHLRRGEAARARSGAAREESCVDAESDGSADDRVDGELLTFALDRAPLAALDAYEGFAAAAPSLFVRVLVRVELPGAPPAARRAWTYVAGAAMAPASLTRWSASRWPQAAPG